MVPLFSVSDSLSEKLKIFKIGHNLKLSIFLIQKLQLYYY